MERDEILRRLQGMKPFAKWSREDLLYLAERLRVRTFRAGETIFAPGGHAANAYIIHEGQVRQSVTDSRQREWRFRTLNPGEIFGQQALFHERRYASKAVAVTSCVLLEIHAADLAWALNRYPDLWRWLLKPDVTARLRNIPLFRSLSDAQIERLAEVTESREFKAGQLICQADDPEGALWIIDWGQVEISHQAQMQLSGGQMVAGPPSPKVLRDQGIPAGQRLTAGNWFIGGLVRIPHQLTVTARAVTKAKLLRIPAADLESTEAYFPDVRTQLRHRLSIPAMLKQLLRSREIFADLQDAHWLDLASYANWEHIPYGLAVSMQGARDRKLYMLITGQARVQGVDDEGRQRPRHVIQAGTVYGFSQLLSDEPRDATVRAGGDPRSGQPNQGAEWLSLHRGDLLYMIEARPKLWQNTRLQIRLPKQPRPRHLAWLGPDERLEYHGRRHWIALVRPLVLPLILAVFWTAFASWPTQPWHISLLAYTMGLLAIIILGLPIPIIDYFDDYYAITSKRIIVHERWLIFSETQREAPLERVQDVTVDTNLPARLFGYGDLTIRTAATTGTLRFRLVPAPERVRDIIFAQRRRVQAGRQAGRDELLRQDLIKQLRVRSVPGRLDRVLPADMKPPARGLRGWLRQRIGRATQAVIAPIRALRQRAVDSLLSLLPEEVRQRLREGSKKPKQKKEETDDVIVYRKHRLFLILRAFLPFLGASASLSLLIGISVNLLPATQASPLKQWLLLVLTVTFVSFLLLLGYQVEDWRNDKYILTKRRIIDVEALPFGIREQRRETTWDKVQDARYEIPGPLARLLNYGTVIIQTAAEEGTFDFVNVPRPRLVQQEIFRHLEAYRLQQEQEEALKQQAALRRALQIYDEIKQDAQTWS